VIHHWYQLPSGFPIYCYLLHSQLTPLVHHQHNVFRCCYSLAPVLLLQHHPWQLHMVKRWVWRAHWLTQPTCPRSPSICAPSPPPLPNKQPSKSKSKLSNKQTMNITFPVRQSKLLPCKSWRTRGNAAHAVAAPRIHKRPCAKPQDHQPQLPEATPTTALAPPGNTKTRSRTRDDRREEEAGEMGKGDPPFCGIYRGDSASMGISAH